MERRAKLSHFAGEVWEHGLHCELVCGSCGWVNSSSLASLKQEQQDPHLMSLLLGMFVPPELLCLLAWALGIAGGRKAAWSQEVLASSQFASEQRSDQHTQKPWL